MSRENKRKIPIDISPHYDTVISNQGRIDMKTNKPIHYSTAPYGLIAVIPEGTELTPASNLPDGGWWAEKWEGMSEEAEAWHRNYGFHITHDDLLWKRPDGKCVCAEVGKCRGIPCT
jgi:hypothetical protein